MTSQGKKWIVRNQDGHIYGPFDLDKIRTLLFKSVFSGEEQVAIYPAGDWIAMSSEPELYDMVLEVLSEKNLKAPQHKETQAAPKDQGANQQSVSKKTSSTHKIIAGETTSRKLKTEVTQTASQAKKEDPAQKKTGQTQVIEMLDSEKIKRKKLSIIPLIFICISAALLYYAFSVNQRGSKQPAVSLLLPIPAGGQNQAKSESTYQKGLVFFLKDTFNNYRRAEEAFVEALEANPMHKEAGLSLLLTDYELWPFTKQDNKEQNTVQGVLQILSTADVYGDHRSVGAAVVDLILGRQVGAQGALDSLITKLPGEGRVYALRAQLHTDNQEYSQAAAYFEKAASLIPTWVKPFYGAGLAYARLGDGPSAQKNLVQALKLNPNHSAARIELGIVEAKFFNNEDRAMEYLKVALDSEERLLPRVESRGRLHLAQLLLKAGDAKSSRRQADWALKVNPEDPDAKNFLNHFGESDSQKVTASDERGHMALGEQYLRTNNHLAAQAQFRAAFEQNPKNARAALKAAESLWALHQSSVAFEFLQKAVVADPKFITPYVTLAQYKSERFDFEGASKILEQAAKVNPKSHEVYRGYAEVFFRRGDPAGAENFAQRAIQMYQTDSKSNEVMARIQLLKKDVVKAMQFAKRAVELDQGNPEAMVTYGKAKTMYEGVKAGAEYFTSQIQKYPTWLSLRIGLGEIYLQDEQYANAEPVLSQVVTADSANKEALLFLGDAQALQNKTDMALKNYLLASKADPTDPTGMFRAGELYLKGEKPADALRYFKLVVQSNPLYPRVHYSIARASFNMGLGEDALKELEEEKKMNPKLADPYEFAGDVYMATRKFAQAAREYQKVSEIRPTGASIYVKLAKAYRAQGNLDAASSMLRIGLAKESGFSEIYREQGFIYETKNMGREAAESFRQYLRLNPDPSDKEQIQAKIRELD